ncbi:RnfABCDGE type electron transport complex subunit D [Pseudomonas sp. MWU13-2105]|uniref:RnfABCDGE type electron transport complex subunit D n=1 Tax=Pseudomonas sp. MWU13-2105 TaxID=2935074 RepID=UPI00200BAD53|nr:RnfABCDGE type electron transport complex subunit D [Pseudomonas sp. MWU13-2105]
MRPLETPEQRTRQAMQWVLLATLPGIAVLLWLNGWAILINLLLAGASAVAAEALALGLRRRPPGPALLDGSALVSATLLAIALPPYCPWWLTVGAAASALLLGKHLYGGLGKNPFNPAMLGYALVLVSFPGAMTHWSVNHGLDLPGALQAVFGLHLDGQPDAWVQATALDTLRVNKSLTIDELFAGNPAFGHFGGKGSEWINLAFLAGGAFLLRQKVFSWHAPAGMLGSLFILSLLFWNGSGSDSHGSPLFHLLTGATMLGAFFIVTEPVSGARSPRARLLFGIGVGALTYVIRTWGSYPDGLAFAVLLMNLAVPSLERLVAATQEEPPV